MRAVLFLLVGLLYVCSGDGCLISLLRSKLCPKPCCPEESCRAKDPSVVVVCLQNRETPCAPPTCDGCCRMCLCSGAEEKVSCGCTPVHVVSRPTCDGCCKVCLCKEADSRVRCICPSVQTVSRPTCDDCCRVCLCRGAESNAEAPCRCSCSASRGTGRHACGGAVSLYQCRKPVINLEIPPCSCLDAAKPSCSTMGLCVCKSDEGSPSCSCGCRPVCPETDDATLRLYQCPEPVVNMKTRCSFTPEARQSSCGLIKICRC